MKTKLLLVFLFISTFAYCQIQDLETLASGKIVYSRPLYDSSEKWWAKVWRCLRVHSRSNNTCSESGSLPLTYSRNTCWRHFCTVCWWILCWKPCLSFYPGIHIPWSWFAHLHPVHTDTDIHRCFQTNHTGVCCIRFYQRPEFLNPGFGSRQRWK